jgi:hypothetical protein
VRARRPAGGAQWHPHLNKGGASSAIFERINLAYSVLVARAAGETGGGEVGRGGGGAMRVTGTRLYDTRACPARAQGGRAAPPSAAPPLCLALPHARARVRGVLVPPTVAGWGRGAAAAAAAGCPPF